jgi:hypothetical protein
VISDDYVGDTEANSRLAYEAPLSSDKVNTPSASSDATELTGSDLSPRSQHGEGGSSEPTPLPDTYERMVLNSRAYLCSIPTVAEEEPRNRTTDERSKKDEEKELARAAHRGSELLKDMEGHCMYFVSGWWSYSFCHNNQVKQFHSLPPGKGVPAYPPVEDDRVPPFILGQHRPSKNKHEQKQLGGRQETEKTSGQSTGGEISVKTSGDVRYMVQNLAGGTTCDLTGKPRKVEVQFHCHPQSSDRIGWIKEIATCSYLMVIYTPRLCSDVAFLPPKETQAHQIVCKEVVKEDEIEEYRARRKADTAQNQLAENAREPTRPVVGGITVGGMKQVGQEGKRISPPKPVEQTEAQGEVIARWDPDKFDGRVQRLSDAELKKMGLDPKAVNEMREELVKEAKGKAWKLEVVTLGPESRELHGIVDGDDEDDDFAEGEGRPATDGGNGARNANAGRGSRELDEEQEEGEGEEEGSEEIFKDEL